MTPHERRYHAHPIDPAERYALRPPLPARADAAICGLAVAVLVVLSVLAAAWPHA